MSKQQDKEMYEQFQEWDKARKNRENLGHQVHEFVHNQQQRMNSSAPITLPREYVWAGMAVGGLLILAQFPAMVLGIIVGAVLMLKLNNKWSK